MRGASEMPGRGNMLADLPSAVEGEVTEILREAEAVRIERIVSLGQASPEGFWYDQPTREWVLLVAGRARLRFADEEQPLELTAGDYVDIPPHRRHRVEWTDPERPTIWLAIHYR